MHALCTGPATWVVRSVLATRALCMCDSSLASTRSVAKLSEALRPVHGMHTARRAELMAVVQAASLASGPMEVVTDSRFVSGGVAALQGVHAQTSERTRTSGRRSPLGAAMGR
eukprot:12246664-Alexandrium_andersonii.AAC.3